MSAIFGYILNSRREMNIANELKRTILWNKAYGRQNVEVKAGDSFTIGCCLEKLSKYAPISSPVIKSDDKYAVIDAVVYNRDELIASYHMNPNLSDEEIIFEIADKYGYDCLVKVNGDFAGAIYNSAKKEVSLFCDHMGVRQLYYYISEEFMLFSTDIRGILAISDVDATVSPEWVYANFMGRTFKNPSATEFKNIHRVTPASYMTIKYGIQKLDSMPEIITSKYWQVGAKKIKLKSYDEYKKRLYELTNDAIAIRADATSKTPGAELSGGLDSSVIDIILNRQGRKCFYHSWSLDPKDVEYVNHDERLIINDICKQENIECHYSAPFRVILRDSKMAHWLKEIGLNYSDDEGVYLAYALLPHMNAFNICNTAEYMSAQGCNMVFSGHGGDEGVSHRSEAFELYYHKEYYHYLRIMWSRTHGNKHRILNTIKKCRADIKNNKSQMNHAYTGPISAPDFLTEEFSKSIDESIFSDFSFNYDLAKYVSASTTQNRLINVSLYGAYNGVRYVFPYLDYRLIDFAISIPRHLHINWKWNRLLFRETFKDIMPSSLYKLRTKEDFSGRAERNGDTNKEYDWFSNFQKEMKYTLTKLDTKMWSQYINMAEIERMINSSKPDDSQQYNYDVKLFCLKKCSYVQSAVEKARSLPIK